jgi:hypothetical protein
MMLLAAAKSPTSMSFFPIPHFLVSLLPLALLLMLPVIIPFSYSYFSSCLTDPSTPQRTTRHPNHKLLNYLPS